MPLGANDPDQQDAQKQPATPETDVCGSAASDCSAAGVSDDTTAFREFCLKEATTAGLVAAASSVVLPYTVLTPEQISERQVQQRRRFELERNGGTLPK